MDSIRWGLDRWPAWATLALAIGIEVLATSALNASAGFTRWGPTVAALLGYALAFYSLSLTLRSMSVGVVYAIWSGVGLVGITLIGRLLFGQALSPAAWLGMGLIVAGVFVLRVWG